MLFYICLIGEKVINLEIRNRGLGGIFVRKYVCYKLLGECIGGNILFLFWNNIVIYLKWVEYVIESFREYGIEFLILILR